MSRIATLIAVMPVLGGTVPADAAAIFLQRTSTLTASGAQCPPFSCTTIGSTTAGVTDFAPFSDSISYQGDSSASQQSSLNATQIVVQNNVTAEPPFLGSADSYFSVQFSIADTENFNFTGVMLGNLHISSAPWGN